MRKLNVGCGTRQYKDFVNVDFRKDVNPDFCCDVSKLSIFKDEEFDFILAEDILEHFSHRDIWNVLAEWLRVLKGGGKLQIQVPSIDRIYADRDYIINYYKGDSTNRFSKLIFGGQDYAGNFHTVCFTKEFFVLVEQKLNVKIVEYTPEIGQYNQGAIFEKGNYGT